LKTNGIITLTTDFGMRDHYGGAMKGAVLSVNPSALMVDISHSISPGDIFSGALVMRGACGFFPGGTVHVGVVDPGVGGPRRAVVIETERYFFVGPDNALLSLAAEDDGIRRVVEIRERRYMRAEVSATFHGRDIFGPVAAHLSRGVPPGEFGPETTDLEMINIPEPRLEEGTIIGEVIHVDAYGNLMTNIGASLIEGHLKTTGIRVEVRGREIGGLYRSYASIEPRGLGALIGSSGLLEVAAREASAADGLGVGVGEEVRVREREREE